MIVVVDFICFVSIYCKQLFKLKQAGEQEIRWQYALFVLNFISAIDFPHISYGKNQYETNPNFDRINWIILYILSSFNNNASDVTTLPFDRVQAGSGREA